MDFSKKTCTINVVKQIKAFDFLGYLNKIIKIKKYYESINSFH